MKAYLRFLEEARSQKGSVFVLVAVAALMLIAATGAAVDMARAQVLQAKIQTALDAAGLAAGATANTIDVQTQAQKYFSANFPTGYLGSGTVTVVATINSDQSVVTLNANTTQATTFMKAIGINTVRVAANTQITRANEGMELVLVLDNTGSMGNAVNSHDSSTSKMDALQSAINGSGGLLDILYGPTSDTVDNLWVGVVPFSQAVNISTGYSSWMSASLDAGMDFGPKVSGSGTHCTAFTNATTSYLTSPTRCTYNVLSSRTQPSFGLTNWAGCVMARSATATSPTDGTLTLDSSDDYPTSGTTGTLLQAYDYASTAGTSSSSDKCSGGSNAWECDRTTGSGSSRAVITTYYQEDANSGGNYDCPVRIQPMVSSKTTISNEVSSMQPAGSTFIDLGMSWGYRMLSPNWAGHWGGEMDNTGNVKFPTLPLPYHTALMNKVLILMTDGMNEFDSGNFTAYGQLSDGKLGTTRSIYSGNNYSGSAEQVLDNHTLAVCTAMKNNGVIIYTIGFGQTDDDNASSSTSVNGALLKACATQYYAGDTSHYFLAPTNAQLSAVFQQIGNSLANLRVSQ